ncbi:MAG: hypothetical protein CVV30_00665 [Methanomicrobiales archaeon HGW-Methanomicrobiales-1]|jgi:hypothetical protein|nr:MAG: hypothetical protein CVV30_00665 [Methanomicrobiales archaeon HGW-Methanomicrobiales-1]
MGICTDIMHDFVLQEIKHIYSTFDGWKITLKKKGTGYDTIVLVKRMNNGYHEIVRILVTFKKEVTLDMIDELIHPEPVFDGTIPRYDYAIIVPAHADTSKLPKDLKIFVMKSFAFEGKELAWIKKPVRKTETPGVTP